MAETKWTWQQAVLESKLPSTVKLVLLVIGCHMNAVGEGCYPSTLRIADEASLSERAVCTAIATAKEMGWLAVKPMELKGRKWRRHCYFPQWPQAVTEGTEPRSVPQREALNVTTRGTERSDTEALNVVQLTSSLKSSVNLHAQARASGGAALARKAKAGDDLIDAKSLGDLAKMLTKGNA